VKLCLLTPKWPSGLNCPITTTGVLHQLLSWSKLKQSEFHSSQSVSDTANETLHTDITSLVHLLVRQIDSCSIISATDTGERESGTLNLFYLRTVR